MKRKNRFVRKTSALEILSRIALILSVLALLGWAMNEDYKDAVKDERHYCQMVNEGRWPAYKGDSFCN